MIPPLTILITSQACGACRHFRGETGKPISGQDWSPELIKKFLTGSEHPTLQSHTLSSEIIDIHLTNMDTEPDLDNIDEVNCYYLTNLALTRLIYKKLDNGQISFTVEVDGIINPELSKLLKTTFFNDNLPKQVLRLVNQNSDVLYERPENQNVEKIFNSYAKDPSSLISEINRVFNFKWWVSFVIPPRIKDLVSFFPTFIFVSLDDWIKSIEYNSPLFGYVADSEVSKNSDGTYSSNGPTSSEDPVETLERIFYPDLYRKR